MRSHKHTTSYATRLLFTLVIIAWTGIAHAEMSPYDWAFVHLDYVRKAKVAQLESFCERIHSLTERVCQDDVVVSFFEINLKYSEMKRKSTPPQKFTRKIKEFQNAFNEYYVKNCLSFYDVLFVDSSGQVVYSIRKELANGEQLWSEPYSQTPLAKCLQKKPKQSVFVGFHDYKVSNEPAAFFVEPVFRDEHQLGWIVLQFAINKINSLFAGTEKLGETGEAIVVNRVGYMLTESSFEGESTILTKRLDNSNISIKYQEGQGHRIVTDYRGFTVLTSFEVVNFLGEPWLIVAKVDEAQITTQHFMQYQDYYDDQLMDYLEHAPARGKHERNIKTNSKIVRQVDMDEFVKASHDELLQTLGVSTCTAVVATYPGKFGYLVHISPLDQVYGGQATNLLGHITKKIKTYDIYKYERRRVRFVVVARHLDSLLAVVHKLINEGFLLSQISVMYNPQAKCANVVYDYSEDHLNVEWIPQQTGGVVQIQYSDAAYNLGDIIRDSIDDLKLSREI